MLKLPQSWKSAVSRFLAAQTISLFGSAIVQYAIIWYITLTTTSGLMLTISAICGFVPQLIISLFGGVLIDRYNRKVIIMISDAVIALATLLLALAFLSGFQDISLLFAALVVRSFGAGLQTPAVNAFIPQLTPEDKLMKVNGINSTLSSMILFLSPAVSGVVLSLLSIEAALFIDVITAIIGIGLTATVRVVYPIERETKKSTITEITAGFSYLKKHSMLSRLLVSQFVVFFLISPSVFLTPLMVARNFGAEVWRLTASEMTYSLGMVLGGILITWWGGFKNRIHTILFAGAVYGAIMLGLGLAPVFLLYLILNVLIGVISPCYNTPLTVLLQEKVAASMQGRIFSLMQISTSCAFPLGMIFFGPLADFVSIKLLLVICGILVTGVSVILYQKKLIK